MDDHHDVDSTSQVSDPPITSCVSVGGISITPGHIDMPDTNPADQYTLRVTDDTSLDFRNAITVDLMDGERIMGQGVGVDVPAAKKAMVRDLLWRSFLGTLSDKVNLCRLPDVLVPLVEVLSEDIREETRCLASDFEEQVASILRGRSAS